MRSDSVRNHSPTNWNWTYKMKFELQGARTTHDNSFVTYKGKRDMEFLRVEITIKVKIQKTDNPRYEEIIKDVPAELKRLGV